MFRTVPASGNLVQNGMGRCMFVGYGGSSDNRSVERLCGPTVSAHRRLFPAPKARTARQDPSPMRPYARASCITSLILQQRKYLLRVLPPHQPLDCQSIIYAARGRVSAFGTVRRPDAIIPSALFSSRVRSRLEIGGGSLFSYFFIKLNI